MTTVTELIELKKKYRLTNAEIAEESKVPLGTVNKIFAGQTKHPHSDTLTQLQFAIFRRAYVFQGEKFEPAEHFSNVSYVAESAPYGLDKGRGYTIDDYYALPDDRRVELINGQFFTMEAPGVIHQKLVKNIAFSIESYIRSHHGKCQLMVSPADVKIYEDEDDNMFQPDLFIACDPSGFDAKRFNGPPDWICEILSPSTAKRDSITKLNIYCEAGVRECWYIDPDRRKITVYSFDGGQHADVNMYTFKDKVPLGIYEDCVVDFQDMQL